MVFQINNREVTLYRGNDSYEIFKELKEFLRYNPELYNLKRFAGIPQDQDIDINDVVQLQALLPHAERVSKDMSDWLTYHINRQSGKSVYYNDNYYGGNYGDTFIPARNRKDEAPNYNHVIKLNRGKNKVVFPSGWFFDVYYYLKENHVEVLRANQNINGVNFPSCVQFKINNKLQYKSERVYTCGDGHLKDRQLPALDKMMDALTSREGFYRTSMLWKLHIGYGKTFLSGAFIDNVVDPKVVFPIASKSLMLKSIPDYAGIMGYKVSVICPEYLEKDIRKAMNSPVIESDDGHQFRIPDKYLEETDYFVGDEVTLKRTQSKIIPLNGHGIFVFLQKGEKFKVKELPHGLENVTFNEITDFTFVMVPTFMNRLEEYRDQLSHFNICIVDECNEHLSNKCLQFYEMLDVGMMIGMSGTPYGSPDQSKHILCTDIFGKPLLDEDLNEGIGKDAVVPFDIEVYVNHNKDVEGFASIDTHVYLARERFLQTKACIDGHKGESIFIYTGHAELDYGYMLESFLKANGYQCAFINGSIPTSEYVSTLEQFKRGHLPILISNRVLTSGENLNVCSVIIVYYSGTNDVYIVQSIGRILRLHSGKERATVALFEDKRAGRYSLNHKYQLQKYLNIYPDASVIKFN
jgi:hypothetical protein